MYTDMIPMIITVIAVVVSIFKNKNMIIAKVNYHDYSQFSAFTVSSTTTIPKP